MMSVPQVYAIDLNKECERWSPPPAEIEDHFSWLREQSRIHNLTRVPETDWWSRHVLDSVVPLSAGWTLGTAFLDLGTGPGFPGVPLAVYTPSVRFALLESKEKVCRALRGFLNQSDLSSRGVVFCGRSEDLAHSSEHRGRYDRVVTRAVAGLRTILELGIPFLKEGGEIWCWKSDLEEIHDCRKAFAELNAVPEAAVRYRLPGEKRDRHIIRVRRVGPVPDRYPRRAGIPRKRPL